VLNGDAHLSEIEGELRCASDPLLNFQTDRAHDSRECATLHREVASHRILYAGDDIGLPARLKDGLKRIDCFLVRSPVLTARTFIRSDIKYSLLLVDETTAGAELEAYARTLAHREWTPVIIVKKSESLGGLLEAIRRRLD
jgi:hypothetical protein